MSLEAMTWALKRAPVYEPTAVLVLMGLADHASDDGSGCWPSRATLAKRGRCSERTVQRHLRQLEADGIIRRGDQKLISHLRADHRPVVYDLDLTRVLTEGDVEESRTARARGGKPRDDVDVTPLFEADGATPETSRGDVDDADGATPATPEPELEPSGEPELLTEPPSEVSARTLVAEWIDHCQTKPASRVIGQVARELKILLETDGMDPDVVRRGLAEWHRKRIHPSALASVVTSLALGPAERQSRADRAVEDGSALIARLAAEEAAALPAAPPPPRPLRAVGS